MDISNQGQHFSLLNLQNGNTLPKNNEVIKHNSNEAERLTAPPIKEQNEHRGFIEPVKSRTEIGSDERERSININLQQVTINEVREIFANENIKGANEIISALDVMPYWDSPVGNLNKNHVQLANQYTQQKIDLLSKMENVIEEKRVNSQPTNLFQEALDKLNRFNESVNNVKIDFLT